MTDQRIPGFTAKTSDGSRLAWDDMLAGQPIVVVFIKQDCPCSVDFEPFFHRLASAYRGAVGFLGVIDADVDAARQYATANRVPYPVLADPRCQIIRRFAAEHGSYVALVRPDGTLEALWPGISGDMMLELSGQIARLAQVAEQLIEVDDLPKALMTGCPFPLTPPSTLLEEGRSRKQREE